MAKILLAEDDEMVMFGVTAALEAAAHTVEAVISGQEALERLRFYQYDAAVLDWGLPVISGVEICKQYRERGGKMPILMLTGKAAISDKAHGLDAGADDYLTKPFSMEELMARIRALLRRSAAFTSSTLTARDLTVDTGLRTVFRGAVEIKLLPREYALLEFLLRNKNQVIDVANLLNRVWSSESDATEDAVRQCLMRLRKKVEVPGQEPLIKTVKGMGYVVEDPQAGA